MYGARGSNERGGEKGWDAGTVTRVILAAGVGGGMTDSSGLASTGGSPSFTLISPNEPRNSASEVVIIDIFAKLATSVLMHSGG